MNDSFHLNDFSRPIYLYQPGKFWEIRLDSMTYKSTVRCGKLFDNGDEDSNSFQTLIKDHKSWSEAVTYTEKHVKMKMEKGYQFLERVERQDTGINFLSSPASQNWNMNLNNSNSQSQSQTHSPTNLKRRADNSTLQREDLKHMKKTEKIVRNLHEEDEFQLKQIELGEYSQKSYRIENLKDSEKPIIEKKAHNLDLICEFLGTKISVIGFEKKIDEFVVFLKHFIKEKKDAETNESMIKEISITPELIKYAVEIEQRGLDLGLICEVQEKIVIAQGRLDQISQLELFIQDKKAQKSLVHSSAEKTMEKEINLSSVIKIRREDIENQGDKFGVFCEFTETKLIMLGTPENISEMLTYLFELKEADEVQALKENLDEYSQKEVKVTDKINELLPEIKKKAEELDLIIDVSAEKLLIAGFEKKMNEIMKFIEAQEKAPSAETSSKIFATSQKSNNNNNEELTQKEISISTFHRVGRDEVEAKANELGLITDFGYDVILVSGLQSNINSFIGYLYEYESKAKKALYPKYWDFHEVNAFSMAEIPQTSEEFKDIEKLFLQTMHGHQILKLERIQNKYLMEHYVTNLQKRKELNSNQALNRMLLFHGTRQTKPEIIYKNFDVGFDLQYANQGMYGKGLYFAVAAQYSHSGFVYTKGKGKFQLLVADVFVGKSKKCPTGQYIKAPEGYDSVSANDQFYIIYNNFHSYPLYLMEYK